MIINLNVLGKPFFNLFSPLIFAELGQVPSLGVFCHCDAGLQDSTDSISRSNICGSRQT
jgi:hypothetical protein